MSVKNFIPQIWSARLLANLDKNLVYANAVNRDYEGEIKKFGDTVKINQMGDVTVKDYKGGAIEDPEELNSNQTILT
ncbi:P22 coat protein - protein 5 domain protein, partial (plasmid) [Clostridium perfringens]